MVKKTKEVVKEEQAIKFDDKKVEETKSKLNPKDLIGLTIKVNYYRTSCYLDNRNHIYIGLDGKGEYLIEKELKDTEILNQYLKTGNVFLYKGELNVTKNFGGTAEIPKVTERTPIFNIVNEFKYDERKDKVYVDILSNNRVDNIITSIGSFDLNTTKRILELETRGYNNLRKARAEIVDTLRQRIKDLERGK